MVVADPGSLKSLLLGLLQTLSQLSELGESWWSPLPEQRELETEARVSSRVLHMFHRGVLLLDEASKSIFPIFPTSVFPTIHACFVHVPARWICCWTL